MDQKLKISEVLKKYTMIIALAVIVILFTVNTGGKMLLPQNVNNLIAQNAYVFILATGMLFCILTGGNIDLSVGSVVCFVGAIGGKILDCLCQDSSVYRYPGRHADVQGTFQRGASGNDAGSHTGPVSGAVQYLCAGFLCCGGL